jgi:hypothetical protein
MAKTFSDGLAKSLGLGLSVVAVFTMVMFSILPFGILANYLNVKSFFWVKFSVGALFSLLTFIYYVQFAKKLKVPSITWLFGAILAVLWAFDVFFIITDFVLKLVGIE